MICSLCNKPILPTQASISNPENTIYLHWECAKGNDVMVTYRIKE